MTTSRREVLKAIPVAAALAAAGAVPAGAIAPVTRSGKPRLRLGLAAYSLRDHLTGKLSPSMTLDDFIEKAVAWEVDAVELTSYYFPPDFTPAYVAGLKRHCHLAGIDVSTTPIRNTFTHPPGPEREKEIAHVKRWLDVAADLGSPAIRIFAGDGQKGQPEAEARRNCVECIEACADHAARRGVFLALENHHGVVAGPDGLLEIVKAVRSDWFGVNLDTGNFQSADPYADLARCAPYAVTVQVKVEIQPKGGPKQEADLGRLVRMLKDAGYRGYVTLEYEAAEAPLTAVPRYLERLRALL
ncbi:MAG TPA: sugar phosphate isomerase/epimerase family protein [Vicinamibacteria bacterium]|nr:sugar phosphate isomerase/epimerase family protein [Vicinamibacteria bacterium]